MNRVSRSCTAWLLHVHAFAGALLLATPVRAGILVIAPHPDDDVIIAAGVVHKAHERGERVSIVFMTNGDKTSVGDGLQRQSEAVAAQALLGTSERDLIFLGYPDWFLQDLMARHSEPTDHFVADNGQSETYGQRGLGEADFHSHRFGSPAAYNGANLVLDLQTAIGELRPDHIFVTSEFDGHPDHAATYGVLRAALTNLMAMGHTPVPTIHKTLVHAKDSIWPPLHPDPQGLHTVMPRLDSTPLRWSERESLNVPAPMAIANLERNLKYRSLQAHVSQARNGRGFIGRFARKDEVFWVENVFGSNQPPTVNAGPDLAIGPYDTILLDGSASRDPEGQLLQFQWRQIAGPAVVLSDAQAMTPSFEAPDTQIFSGARLTFEVTVSDGEFITVPDSVEVLVAAKGPGRRLKAAAIAVAALGLFGALAVMLRRARRRARMPPGTASPTSGDA